MGKEIINPSGMRVPRLNSHGVKKSGAPVFICGQVGKDADGNLAGDGSAEAQVEQIFSNLGLIMESAGGGLNDLVKLTVFVTDPAVFPVVTAARERYFEPGGYPATTYLVVSALASPGLDVEIEAVAVVD